MNHTPGPWKWSTRIAEWTMLEGPNGEIITWADITCPGETSKEETKANAQLIAATPGLLEELEELATRAERCRNILQARDGGNWGMLDTSTARMEIAKATGKETS